MQKPFYSSFSTSSALPRSSSVLRVLLLSCLLVVGALSSAWASHYRYGTLTWRTVTTDASKRTIELRVSNSFRRSFFAGSPVVGSVVSNAGTLNFGDGSTAAINLTVTSVDVAADIFYGEYTVTHVYPVSNPAIKDYTAFYTSQARVSTLTNNADQPWYIKSVVNVGTGNSSPISTLPPVVNLATNQPAATFRLPANDPDGDALTYALATSADMGNISFTNAPGLTVNATTGVVKFNTSGLAVDKLYNAVIRVSDGKTSILVDFIIKVTRVSAAPQFDYSLTPTNGYLYQVAPGTTVTFRVRATDSDAGDIVNLQGIGLPPGSVMSPALPATGNPVLSQFTWTPTLNTLGTSVITFVAQDAVGVQSTTSVTIQVSTKPTFDVPPTPSTGSVVQITPGTTISQLVQVSSIDPNSPVRLLSATGLPGASYSPALPTTAANPTRTTLTWTPVLADWGSHTVIFTAANSYNDQKTHSLEYIVNSAPSFTSTPGSLNVVAGQPFHYDITTTDPDLPYGDELEIEHSGLPAWLTLTDNGDGTGSLDGTPTVADAGANAVTLVAADLYHHGASYGLITQSFSINVIPCSAQALAHDVALKLDANGQASVTAAQVDNGSTATCGIASLTVSPASFDCSNMGANPVALTLTDTYGNVSTATATVTVADDLLPTITAPAAVVVSTDAGQCSATGIALGTAAAGDNCTSVMVSNDAPATFAKGVTTVTWTATDAAGNVTTATQTVTVNDTELPTIAAPAAVVVSTDANQCSATGVTLGTAATADNCSGVIVTNDAPTSFAKGLTIVTWTATDAAGNVATATQTVTVNDTQLPTITAPAAVVVSTDAGQCSATGVALGNAAASDNCSGAVVSNDAPATFAKGTTTVTWTATDAAGNTAKATQTVTVQDTEMPLIAAPAAVIVSTDRGQCSATNVALGNSVATDNCGATVTNNAPATFAKGTTTVTWTATDAAGNVATATQTVTVKDTEKPTISAPAAVTVSANAGQCSATGVALGNASAGDNCTGVVVSNNAPATFAKGITTVTWTATDAAGNTAIATQLVTVKDTEKPVLTVPAAIVVNAPATQCGAAVTFAPTATDNCAGATVVASPASGSTFPVGTSTVTVLATDASGNTSSSSFTVTVKDVTAPAVAVRNVTVTLVNGAASVTAANVNNGSTDACGIASYSLNRTAFSCANLGSNPVVLTVTDIHGNVASAPATVTVVGTIPAPAISVTPASTVYTGGVATNLYLGYGSQSVTLTAKGGVSYVWSSTSGLSSSTVANPVFTATTAGTFTYTVTVTNEYGCTAIKAVTLRVIDARCDKDKVVVCHNGHEICISPNAVPAHLTGHAGDQLGTCGTAPGTPPRPAASAPAAELATKLVFEAYPNPFGASTTVHFRPTVSAPAQVRVFDAVGRVVGTLFSGTTEAGHDYALTLDGTQLATGLYLCRYESQGQVHTQRLSVVK